MTVGEARGYGSVSHKSRTLASDVSRVIRAVKSPTFGGYVGAALFVVFAIALFCVVGAIEAGW